MLRAPASFRLSSCPEAGGTVNITSVPQDWDYGTGYARRDSAGCWLLTFAYTIASHTSAQELGLPGDPATGMSHAALGAYGIDTDSIRAARFYCTSSAHTRVVNFVSTHLEVKPLLPS